MSRIIRRDFLKSTALGAAALAIGVRPARASEDRPPNFVVIHVDDLGWMDLGCQGSEVYDTPNIDRLAAEGMRFTGAYSAAAVCSPTRGALLTGRYPTRFGITDWIRARFQGGEIPEDKQPPTEYVTDPDRPLACPPNGLWLDLDEITIADALSEAGYACCHVGKWHLGADPWYPDRHGFDYNIGGDDSGQPPSYFDPYVSPTDRRMPTLEPREEGEYLTDREADEAADFIRRYADHPFFLHLAHYAVHTPVQAKEELIERYENRTPRPDSPEYAAMIHSVDEAAGKVAAALDETGAADNTLIIFTSDNGGHQSYTSMTPLREGKGTPYEGGIRVPLIIRWPGVAAPGTISREPVTSVDYFPTILDAAGVAPPAGRPIDGVSLVAHLRSGGSEPLDRGAIYWHFPHYRDHGDIRPYSIVRAGDWKLLKWWEGPSFELYNLSDDLSEEHDLAGEETDKTAELDALLTAWLEETGAKLPKPKDGV